jgi:hypothetical protein
VSFIKGVSLTRSKGVIKVDQVNKPIRSALLVYPAANRKTAAENAIRNVLFAALLSIDDIGLSPIDFDFNSGDLIRLFTFTK